MCAIFIGVVFVRIFSTMISFGLGLTNELFTSQNLKNTLDAEKNKKLQDLEARLMRRRMLRKKELAAAARECKDGPESDVAKQERKELEAAMAAAEKEVEAEMKSTAERYQSMEEGLISGFKKRCLQEAKSAKEKGRALTEEERQECYRSAADAVKNRFERDQKALLDSLEAERTKQKKRMLKQLAAKKAKMGNANPEELQALDNEAMDQMKLLNVNFDDQATEALAKPQVRYLVFICYLSLVTFAIRHFSSLFIYFLSLCLSVCLSVCLFLSLSACLPVCLSVCCPL